MDHLSALVAALGMLLLLPGTVVTLLELAAIAVACLLRGPARSWDWTPRS